MPRSRYQFGEEKFPYFLTNTVVAWLPVFYRPEFASVILESWRFLQRDREIKVYAFVIMENHLHWIAAGPQLSKRVREFKSYTATTTFKLMEKLGCETMLQEFRFYKSRHKTNQTHQLWQEGSHPQQITSDEMFEQKVEYIHNNPVRRGYVDDPVHWRYSSARIYAGDLGLLDICLDW